jgi:predicted nucleic acid-binding protein
VLGEVNAVLVPQVLLEFYATITCSRVQRPLGAADAWQLVDALAGALPVLNVRSESLPILGELVAQERCVGPRIFDLYLAAQMRSHGVTRICTDSVRHFQRLGVEALTPERVLAGIGGVRGGPSVEPTP